MHVLSRLLNWGGIGSVALGGLLALLSLVKGKEARQLESALTIDSLAALKQLLGVVPLLVAITGRVLSDKPLKGELSSDDAAIVQTTEERVTERRTELVWVKESDLVRSVIRETEWGLTDRSGVVVPVVSGQDAGGSFMQVAADVWQPAHDKSLAGVVVGELSGRRFLGMRKVERVLPLGTAVTAVGELAAVPDYPRAFKGALRSRGMMYVLREPKSGAPFVITRQPLPELIGSLRATSSTCRRLSAVFTAVGASMLLLSAAQHAAVWLRHRKYRIRRDAVRRARAAAAAGRPEGEGGEEALGEEASPAAGPSPCVVCCTQPCDMIFAACGHMCVCSSCAGSLDRCPMCRVRGTPRQVYHP